jgi:hypothetical protein
MAQENRWSRCRVSNCHLSNQESLEAVTQVSGVFFPFVFFPPIASVHSVTAADTFIHLYPLIPSMLLVRCSSLDVALPFYLVFLYLATRLFLSISDACLLFALCLPPSGVNFISCHVTTLLAIFRRLKGLVHTLCLRLVCHQSVALPLQWPSLSASVRRDKSRGLQEDPHQESSAADAQRCRYI